MHPLRKLLLGNRQPVAGPNRVYRKLTDNLKAIWENKTYDDFGTERLLRLFLQTLAFVLPGTFVRKLIGFSNNLVLRRLGVELYGLAKPVWYLAVIWFHLSNQVAVLVLSIVFTMDTLYFSLSRIFLNDILKVPLSYRRSLLLISVNFAEMCLCFALIYLFIDSRASGRAFSDVPISGLQAIYFSVVTAATVGYGDIKPQSSSAMIAVIAQIFVSMFFVVVLLSHVTGKLDEPNSKRDSQSGDTSG